MSKPPVLALIIANTLLFISAYANAAYIGKWSFDTNYRDSTPYGNHLTAISGAPSIVPGIIGNAASFDGSQFLYSSNGILTASRTEFSMGAWIKTSSSANGPDAVILGNFYDAGTQVYRAGLTDHHGTVYGYVHAGNNNVNSSGRPSIHDGRWHHVAITFGPDGSDSKLIKLYIDGNLVLGHSSIYLTTVSVTEFSIGGRSHLNNTFTGLIDEAFFSADELSAAEIAALATAPDADSDGVPDWEDNCPNAANPGQENHDTDDLGDACDYDDDNDGLDDDEELYIYLTDPLNPDTDHDGLFDGLEVIVYGTDPLEPDSDNDGLTDGEERDIRIDPLDSDSDNDGFGDGVEVSAGTNPNSVLGPWPPADGDLAPLDNYDGMVNVADYLVALRMALGLITPTDLHKAHGDLDGSGEIDLPDLIRLQQVILGL